MRHPVTLVLLPGLDGTDVFFRPLMRELPAWVTPVAIQYPPDGGTEYGDLFDVVTNAVRDLSEFWVLSGN